MALRTFGGAPSDVTTDSQGNVAGGVSLKVYSAATGGTRVTALYDLDGAPLAGEVTSITDGEDEGRVVFKASDEYAELFLDAGYGMRWALTAREAISELGTAITRSGEAISTAATAVEKADDAIVAADQAKAAVNSMIGLDITQLTPQYVTQLWVDPIIIMQSFVKNPLNGQFFVSQTGAVNGSTNDLIIYRCAPDGRVLDKSTLIGGGHGSSITMENVGADVYIWLWWELDTTGTATQKSVRWKYSGGKTVLRNDPDVLNIPTFTNDAYSNWSIDQASDLIAIRVTPATATERLTLRRLSDYKNGVDDVLADIGPITYHASTPFQGFVTIDDHVYVTKERYATENIPSTITRYNWYTKETAVVDVTSVGEGLDGTFLGNKNEMEGVCAWRSANGEPSLLMGKAVGGANQRQALVYAFVPPRGDALTGEVVRRQVQRIQSGRVEIVPVKDTPTKATVVFPQEFDTAPIITTSANTSGPGNIVLGTSATNVTTKGCDIYLTRTSTTSTSVYWVGIA